MSPALLALSLVSHLHCASVDGLNIFAEVEVINRENFEVKLHNDTMEMPVHQKRLGFNELGELAEIETSAWWELFHVKKIDGLWTGEYWYDNSLSKLNCKEKL